MVHSTTLVTNALIERRGAKTGLITTEGFRDVLEIGTEQIYDIYDLFAPVPEPLIPRSMRLEVNERLTSDGEVVQPLDPADIAKAAGELVNLGAESIAISFLHSYRDARHEELAAQVISNEFPDIALSVSSRVAPLVGEYERTSSVAADAYVKPTVSHYLRDLISRLRDMGLNRDPYVMLSSGGTTAAETAAEYPIRLLESGPAAGALAAKFFGSLAGRDDVLALDMGGTTAKACLIESGKLTVKQWLEVDRVHRFKPGSGLPVMTPTIDLIEIGAGGGSIAWINELGLLKVGPLSASSEPGPASYGQGGTEPTVTDANLVLGYLASDSFLGGRMTLDTSAAREAINHSVAVPLGLEMVEAAWGIHSIVNENMAAAARLHIIERNRDPRDFTLVAFGGAGPAHASAVGRLIGSREILFPLGAGVASAIGALVAPLSFSFTRAHITKLNDLNNAAVQSLYADMEEEALRVLSVAGVTDADVTIRRSVDLRFSGQYHELEVPLPASAFVDGWEQDLAAAFVRRYREHYGRELTGLPIESLNWKIVAEGGGAHLTLAEESMPHGVIDTPLSRTRRVYFPHPTLGYVECPVYDRNELIPGMRISGPAIVEEPEATIVVWPGDQAFVDGYRTLVVTIDQ
jgi:N-methylhydantoinase A/oxoprolinase/acetone carboxylase beta subunit